MGEDPDVPDGLDPKRFMPMAEIVELRRAIEEDGSRGVDREDLLRVIDEAIAWRGMLCEAKRSQPPLPFDDDGA